MFVSVLSQLILEEMVCRLSYSCISCLLHANIFKLCAYILCFARARAHTQTHTHTHTHTHTNIILSQYGVTMFQVKRVMLMGVCAAATLTFLKCKNRVLASTRSLYFKFDVCCVEICVLKIWNMYTVLYICLLSH